jgi:hypothetical protein
VAKECDYGCFICDSKGCFLPPLFGEDCGRGGGCLDERCRLKAREDCTAAGPAAAGAGGGWRC